MSDSITRTSVKESEENIIKKQVMNNTEDSLIRHQVRGLDGGGSVPVLTTLTANDNGTYTPGQGIDGYNEVIVDVPASLPSEELISEYDWSYNKLNNLSYYTDKVNGEQSTQSCRNGAIDENGYMYFSNTNGYMWIPQLMGYNKDYKIEIDVIGKSEFIDGEGNNIFKFGFGDNHVMMQWDNSNSNWKMQDWSGHDTRLNEDFTFFNNKKITIYFGCGLVDGVITHNSYFANSFTMYIGDQLIYKWEQQKSLTGNDNIALIGLGHNTACINYKIASLKIYKLNNIRRA